MDFSLTDEQKLLQESVAKFIQNDYSFDVRRKSVSMPGAINPDVWETFASLGWLTVPFSEENGGYGGSLVDVAVLMEELGKGIVVEPIVPTILLAGELIAQSGNAGLKEQWLPTLIAGESQGAFAFAERQNRFQLNDIATTATKTDNGYRINGTKTLVFNGEAADVIIVATRSSGDQYDEAGITLFAIDTKANPLNKTVYHLMDGQQVANIHFTELDVSAEAVLGEVGGGFQLMEHVVSRANIALAAESIGAMEQLYKTTVEYAKTREQFGTAIGKFQVLQHRMVEMFMVQEQARSIVLRALCAYEDQSDNLLSEIAAMKAFVGKAAKLIGEEAIHIHGGMGMTDELDVGHYVKRLMVINTTFGDTQYQQEAFCRLNYGS